MTQHEILDEFYNKLEKNDIDETIIESLKDLILNEKFTKENFIELIEGAFDGQA